MNLETIRNTDENLVSTGARLVAALPLLGIGVQHAIGTAPLLPILEGTVIPFPEINAVFGTVTEIAAGVLLLLGYFARIGALMSTGAMAMALFTHLTFAPYIPVGETVAFTWPDEPPIVLPIVVLLAASWVIVRGAGRFSFDAR